MLLLLLENAYSINKKLEVINLVEDIGAQLTQLRTGIHCQD